eukprot:72136-Pyramimonas_sp.AAC.2
MSGAQTIEVHCLRGDATHQEAIDKAQVHAALVGSVGAPDAIPRDDAGAVDLAALGESAVAVEAVCDLQPVHD